MTHLAGTVVFGLGATGYSCLRHLHGRGPLTAVDTRAAPPNLDAARRDFPDVEFRCGDLRAEMFERADRIVVSPGVPLDHCLLARARRAGVPLESDISLFLDEARAPVLGITGTNGKSTVTALVGHLMKARGLDVGVGGNLGEPALDLLDAHRDAYVLELSSFQLERLDRPALDVGSVLNVTPDHLDRYPDLDSYAASKQRVYAGCRVAVFNRHDALTAPTLAVGTSVSFGLDEPRGGDWGIATAGGVRAFAHGDRRLLDTAGIRLRGRHNEMNVLAALAIVAARCPVDDTILEALEGFEGLPHRCVVVGTFRDVTWVNDSKATNLGACIAALEGLGDEGRRHIVLIAGGDAKGIDLSPLAAPVARYVRAVVTLGRDAAVVESAVAAKAQTRRVGSMEEAVTAARDFARPGDIVLLAPACSSLDMFRNFEARGDAFAEAVRRLAP
jgi:UDP-N-acetylmuramoylalanine--D-glutamate ligase